MRGWSPVVMMALGASAAIPLHNKGLPPKDWYESRRPGLIAWARQRHSSNGPGIFPLVFSNVHYLPVVAAQWAAMSRIDAILPLQLNIVCLDNASALRLERFNAPPCYGNMTTWHEVSGLWALRIVVLHTLVGDVGLNVLMTDSDAIWLQDPRPPLSAFLETHDIVAQRGSFPLDLSQKWEADTICMGFALFSNRSQTVDVLARLLVKFSVTDPSFPRFDDQWGINHVLDDAGVVWDTADATQTGDVDLLLDGGQAATLKVLLLGMSTYYRGKCDGSMNDDAVILHCNSEKHHTAKLATLSSAGVLFLAKTWERRLSNASIPAFTDRVRAALVPDAPFRGIR